ncbi:hypothetical protein [Rosettibacter firmus]|uniref:hypothetical protein n=1 Tax=Rosettibacter firmus TaxID=3111522 RepID=UPI00336BE5DC
MKNVILCSNCNYENPFYALICKNCKAFLRTKIPNIDLWITIGKLIESPKLAFENIIHAEHKNYLLTLIFLSVTKISINLFTLNNIINFCESSAYLKDILFISLYAIMLFIIMTTLITLSNNFFKLKNRFKDNIAIYTFSFIPIIFSLMILTPVEYAIFGNYWFTSNPSPLIIKKVPAYILYFIEAIFILWSYLLFIISSFVQTRNLIYSIVIGTISFTTITFLPIIIYCNKFFM